MADVTGPISTLPGARRASPEGTHCDNHQDRLAVGRIQGETDSFGSEQHDLCQECLNEMRKHILAARSGTCDWCKKSATDLYNHRDFEEGSCGPVYQVCGSCRQKELDQIAFDEGDEL